MQDYAEQRKCSDQKPLALGRKTGFIVKVVRALTFKLISLFAGGVFALAAGEDLVFDKPNSYIGSAGWGGALEYWVDVAEVPLAGSQQVPLRILFRSAGSEGLLGTRWSCPLLESRVVEEAGGLRFYLPGGGQIYLYRREGGFQSRDGTAEGTVDEIRVRDRIFRFRNGAIAEMTGGGGLQWEQEGERFILKSEGETVLLADRESGEMEGPWGRFVFRLDAGGWKMEFPDGRKEVGVIESDGGTTTLRIDTGSRSREFEWDAQSGALLSDGDFRYERRLNDMGEELLQRVDADGRTEWYTFDVPRGLATYKRQDGTRVQSWYHTVKGPLHMKVFRMDTFDPEWHLISSRGMEYSADGEVVEDTVAPGTARFPVPRKGPRFVSYAEARELHGRAIFVDARSERAWRAGHIEGAVRIGREDFERCYDEHRERLAGAGTIVIYCTSRQCEDASLVASQLVARGHKDVRIFEGGWAEWWKNRRR